MYDIKALEEDWKKYKFKKRKPFYFLISIALFSSIVGFVYVLNSSKELKVFDNFSKYFGGFSKSNTAVNLSNPLSVILINGSLNNLEKYETLNLTKEDPLNTSEGLLVDIPILDVEETSVSKSSVSQRRAKVYLDIFETTSVTAYEDVERRFKQSPDIDDALFLAKSYYKKGNYEKSEYWALETNKLNSGLEESFLIFVKSKAKLGKNNEALSILNSYLNRTNSHEARTLLNQLKNGKL